MRSLFYILFLLPLPVCGWAQGSIITTIAGTGISGYTGDGGPAMSAKLRSPSGVAFNHKGDIYFCDHIYAIRKINTAGIISTFAGNGINGFSGDGGPATLAQVLVPWGIAVDKIGNVYFTEYQNYVVRKVDTFGIISTFAGIGTSGGYSGDGGPATNAKTGNPSGIAIDTKGNILFCDAQNSVIRKVDSYGVITTVAGNGISGYSGDGGPATLASLNSPWGLAVDSTDNIYVSDVLNHKIRKIDTAGIITTFAGNGTGGYSGDGGPATNASIAPSGIAFDTTGNLFIADYVNNRIRKINHLGVITTVAGTGSPGFGGDGGSPLLAQLFSPLGIAIDSRNSICIADQDNNRIRKVYNPQLSINTPAISIESIHLFPNPTCNEITITTTRAIESIEVVNMLGQTIETSPSFGYRSGQAQLKEREVLLSVAHLPAGIYFVKVNGVYAGKFVKE